MHESLKETSVVVQMDNSRVLNMDKIVSDVRAQYEDIAARSREEAETWHKSKVSDQRRRPNEKTDKSVGSLGRAWRTGHVTRVDRKLKCINLLKCPPLLTGRESVKPVDCLSHVCCLPVPV